MAVALNDVRVLVPRVRRALDGPAASGSASVSSTYDDEALKTLVADAIGEVIFFTGGAFPHTLDVAARDVAYSSPTEWAVNPPLSEAEASVIAAQAALNTYFFSLRELKTSETIRDEGQEWSYSISATLVRDQMAYLMRLRDAALAQIQNEQTSALEVYVSFVHERDVLASHYVEPWISGGGGGQELEGR